MTHHRSPAEPRGTPKLDLEALKQRHKDLNERRIREEETLRNAHKELEELKTKARDEHGTDDVEALRQKLDAMRAANEAKRAEYQLHLDTLSQKLAEVESRHHAARGAKRP